MSRNPIESPDGRIEISGADLRPQKGTDQNTNPLNILVQKVQQISEDRGASETEKTEMRTAIVENWKRTIGDIPAATDPEDFLLAARDLKSQWAQFSESELSEMEDALRARTEAYLENCTEKRMVEISGYFSQYGEYLPHEWEMFVKGKISDFEEAA